MFYMLTFISIKIEFELVTSWILQMMLNSNRAPLTYEYTSNVHLAFDIWICTSNVHF